MRSLPRRSIPLLLLVAACASKRVAAEHREVMTALTAQHQQLGALQSTLSAIETEQMNLRARQDDLIQAVARPGPAAGAEQQWRDEVAARLDAVEAKLADAVPPLPPAVRIGQPDPAAVYRMTIDGAHARGNATAKVTVVECSDFQCPYCARVRPTLDELVAAYGKDLRLVFKHNPLPMHSRAHDAAKAAEAAGKQGKFWPMHDRLFDHARELTDENFRAWAAELGLDVDRFVRDMADDKLAARIDAQSKQCNALGARGTPSFFINGRYLSGAQPIESFRALIDEELAKASAKLRKGVKPKKLYDAIVADGRTAP